MENKQSSNAKQVWKTFSLIVGSLLAFIANFLVFMLIAPALVSAASTMAVAFGFALVFTMIAIDAALVVVAVQSFLNKPTNKEIS